MDAKQRESNEAEEQPQMDADSRRLGTANGHEVAANVFGAAASRVRKPGAKGIYAALA
jgi:hypothetical protein